MPVGPAPRPSLPVYARMPRMKMAYRLLWALLSVLGAVALAHVTGLVNPHEKVNGLWLVVGGGR